MNLSKRSKALLLCISIVSMLVIFFFHLDGIGLTGPDEPRYAEVAKEMFLTHDYVTPRIHGSPWLEKPVFYYWCAAGFYSLLGVNETAARLPSAIAAFLLVMGVLVLPRRSIHSDARWLSAVILSTNIGVISFSQAVAMDMVLTATLSIALIVFFEQLFAPIATVSTGLLVLAYISLGISALVKGPVGIVLTVLILIGYFWVSGEWGTARRLRIPLGIVVLTMVALPWYVLCYRANGWTFIDTFFIRHNVERFATNEFKHIQPYWFYFPILFYGLLPWSSFLILFVARIKDLVQSVRVRKNLALIFLSLWILLPFLLFTLSRSKLPGYILPIFAPITLLIGKFLIERPEGGSFGFHMPVVRGILGGEILIFTFLYLFRSLIERSARVTIPSFQGWLGAIVGVSILVLIYCFFSKRPILLLVVYHLLLITTLTVPAKLNILPRLDAGLSVRPAARLIQASTTTPTVFLFHLPRDLHYGFDFYLSKPPIHVESLEELDSIRNDSTVFLALPVMELADQQQYLKEGAKEIFGSPRFKVFELTPPPRNEPVPRPTRSQQNGRSMTRAG